MHINMKYYIVSIGAIFISLGIGILVGYNLNYDQELSKQQASVISDLDNKFDALKVTNDNLEKSLADLSDDYDKAISFINDNVNNLVVGRLTDKNIGIISTNQDNDYTKEIKEIITTANGNVAFDITLNNNIFNEKKIEALATKLNLEIKDTKDIIVYIEEALSESNASLKLKELEDAEMIKINSLNENYQSYDSVVIAGGNNGKLGKEQYENIDKIIDIDQSPIGRTPRSNPATYTGTFDIIRELFSQTPEAKMRGYKPGRFSFNVKGGRCEACSGDGIIKIEMQFLSDVYVPCEVCKGKRYNRETLEVKYKGKNIDDVLNMTVEEALEFFENIPRIKNKIQTLKDVGLGYIRLGQPSTQLSGGEAQRIKLAFELSKRSTGKTLYILDEPTTGLHVDDVNRLVEILQRLVDAGNTVIVIEHNLDMIKCADYIIDLGPEGGDKGGTLVAQGTPEKIVENDNSYTGRYLKKLLR